MESGQVDPTENQGRPAGFQRVRLSKLYSPLKQAACQSKKKKGAKLRRKNAL